MYKSTAKVEDSFEDFAVRESYIKKRARLALYSTLVSYVLHYLSSKELVQLALS